MTRDEQVRATPVAIKIEVTGNQILKLQNCAYIHGDLPEEVLELIDHVAEQYDGFFSNGLIQPSDSD